MNEIQELLNEIESKQQKLEIERLKSEASPLNFKVKIDTEAPETSTEEMKHMFRVIEHGYIWEDKDKTIHNLRQKLNECSNTLRDTVTDLTDKLMAKDRIIHNMKQEMEDMKQRLDKCSQIGYLMNPGFQPPDSNVAVPQLYPIYTPSIQPEECQDFEQYSVCDNCTEKGITQLQHDIARLQEELHQSKQMILRLVNEADTREQDVDRLEGNLHILREELEQTKADHERNQGRSVSVNNFYGTTYILYCNPKDMAL